MTLVLPPEGLNLDLSVVRSISELRRHLRQAGVRLNHYAESFLDDSFANLHLEGSPVVSVVEASVEEIGLLDGGTIKEVEAAAKSRGLHSCPPLTAPLLRIQINHQANSSNSVLKHGRAPDDSLHVLSPSFGDESSLHRGFYLRTVDNVPWLRGFTCDHLHIFGPGDRWVFSRP